MANEYVVNGDTGIVAGQVLIVHDKLRLPNTYPIPPLERNNSVSVMTVARIKPSLIKVTTDSSAVIKSGVSEDYFPNVYGYN